jgi:hypothetical protein
VRADVSPDLKQSALRSAGCGESRPRLTRRADYRSANRTMGKGSNGLLTPTQSHHGSTGLRTSHIHGEGGGRPGSSLPRPSSELRVVESGSASDPRVRAGSFGSLPDRFAGRDPGCSDVDGSSSAVAFGGLDPAGGWVASAVASSLGSSVGLGGSIGVPGGSGTVRSAVGVSAVASICDVPTGGAPTCSSDPEGGSIAEMTANATAAAAAADTSAVAATCTRRGGRR